MERRRRMRDGQQLGGYRGRWWGKSAVMFSCRPAGLLEA
ncbi:hypothetical protein E2C01_093959 [Portunus trituberculatus]|uniref:Uncharacterized protein n=1 Tax=Portunus trituberculatus TaxID=210409 RepID=A0A5B7JVN3_PORTR|nr:hypothetical protein [Portunus trituberculatus]